MRMNYKNGHSTVVVNQLRSIEMVSIHRKYVTVLTIAGIAFLAVKPLIIPVPLFIWNASESVPIGW